MILQKLPDLMKYRNNYKKKFIGSLLVNFDQQKRVIKIIYSQT